MIDSTYSDFDFNMITDGVYGTSIKTDYDTINQSIMNIIMTNKGEVPFDPLFGSNISKMLFEKISIISQRLIEEEIYTALKNYEPRITITNVLVEPDEINLAYDTRIEYIINYLNSAAIFEASLKLQGV